MNCLAQPRLLVVTPTVYPYLVGNYDFIFFLLTKVDSLNLESQNQAMNISKFSRVPQTKFEANRSNGL